MPGTEEEPVDLHRREPGALHGAARPHPGDVEPGAAAYVERARAGREPRRLAVDELLDLLAPVGERRLVGVALEDPVALVELAGLLGVQVDRADLVAVGALAGH